MAVRVVNRPRARQYLIAHPEITLADFAKHDSPQFSNNGPAMPLTTVRGADGSSRWALNPAYESHVRQLRNWTVGASFKQSFPELWELIRLDWYSDVLEFARNDIKNRRPSSHRVS